MRLRFALGLTLILILAGATALCPRPAQGASAPVITSPLDQALQTALPGARLRIIVRLKTAGPPAGAPDEQDGPARLLRRQAVVASLQAAARDSQRDVLDFLSRAAAAGSAGDITPFWIFDGIALSASPELVRDIARRADVASVGLDAWVQWLPAAPISATAQTAPTQPASPDAGRQPVARTLSAFLPAGSLAPGETAWGVRQIGADQVQQGLGIDGRGVTVASVDTGVDWQHPALQANYRGGLGGPAVDHLHNWYDATDERSLYPTDFHGHGTHTMGTIAGQGGIGVAPGARWMAAKGINAGGSGYYSWLHAALQFLMAPGGDTAYAPDVINNSWGNDDGSDPEFSQDIAAFRAAGIFVVFSSGNRGPRPGTVSSPASLPGAISVGATDPDDETAAFSSRGPSPFGEVRPHLSAPGVSIVSSYPGGRYATGSGTSMAAPHAAGAAALLLSARPGMSISATLYTLTSTARPLAPVVPNNTSGWGRIDAYAAVLSVISTGVITGHALDGAQPISGSTVIAASNTGLSQRATTGADGGFSFPAPYGIYTVTAAAFGYRPAVAGPRLVVTHSVVAVDFNLALLPSGIVRGVVVDAASGVYLTRTVVSALGTPESSTAGGSAPPRFYTLNLPAGVYTVEARLLGYGVQTRTVSVADGGISELNFALTPTQRIAFVDSGAWYQASQAPYYRAALGVLGLAFDEYRIKHVPADTPVITQLLQYDTVIWSAPYDSPGLVGAGGAISAYLSTGRNLMISGQDIAYYDGGGYLYLPYFPRLNAMLVADAAPSLVVRGGPASPLAGMVITLAGGDGANNQGAADVVQVLNPDRGAAIGAYDEPVMSADGAGVYSAQCQDYRTAYLAFGFEAINSAADRAEVMRRILGAFATPQPAAGVELLSRDAYATGAPIGLPGQALSHTLRVRHTGQAGVTDTLALSLSGNAWPASLSAASVQLGPCRSALVTISLTVPAAAGWNTGDGVTVTAASANAPGATAVLSFTSKTPAGILLVDDDRFHDREQDYLDALAAAGNTADRWDTGWKSGIAASPPITALRLYPLVIWFNGYDWYDPIAPADEAVLARYLDGGGRLFLTSQAALAYNEVSAFNRRYLGVAAIDFSDATSNVVGAPGTVIGDQFPAGTLLTSGGRFPYNWNLSSSVQPVSQTLVILRGDSGQPFGLARQGAAAGTLRAWRAVFMPFAFEALNRAARADLMNRVVGWLTWLGQSTLAPDRATVRAGTPITYQLVLRADSAIAPWIGPPARVSLSAPLAADLFVVSSTLGAPAAHNAGQWSGAISAGRALTWTFVVTSDARLLDGAVLTAAARIAIDGVGLRFSRESQVRVGAPALDSSIDARPPSPAWQGAVTFTARVTNAGSLAAPAVAITSVVPAWMILLTGTVAGPAGSLAAGNLVTWTGDLAAGAAVTFTYAVSLPRLRAEQREFYHAVLYGSAGVLSQSAVWVTPRAQRYYLPVMTR